MRKIALFFALFFISNSFSYAAPCYGTKMPKKNGFFTGVQSHIIFKRYLKNDYGKLRSLQSFYLLSYGVFDWLSIDLKGGAGYIKQHPASGDEIDYSTGFAGGYGLRLRLYEKNNFKAVFGFQHISVHPKRTYVSGVKNKAVLDDWQVSLLASYDIGRVTPYVGTRWSRLDYIHWVDDNRRRKMSDLTKSTGLILGADFSVTQKLWLNLEGSFFDSDALAVSVNYQF
ncbi:MAG: hypothetical protein Q8O30_02755 [Candidatus Omnitrophota bacterium]|nr:hypothetical protein [Candidatus Omnitrophota bacterium]